MSRNDWNCSRTEPVECRRDCCDCERDCGRCEERHPLPKPVILACGGGRNLNLCFPWDREVAACVEIDTTCLCNHMIKIDFSTNIIFESFLDFGNSARIKFTLVKCCGGDECELEDWFYERDIDVDSNDDVETADSFCFTFCKCVTCAECCTYKVIARSMRGFHVKELKLKNTYMNAIAQSL